MSALRDLIVEQEGEPRPFLVTLRVETWSAKTAGELRAQLEETLAEAVADDELLADMVRVVRVTPL